MLKPLPAGGPIALARAAGLSGVGLLAWAGISTALLQGRGDAFANLRPFQDRVLGSGLLLAAALLVLVLRHADGRQRAWRQRAVASLVLAILADAALVALLHGPAHSPGMIAIAGAITCLAALAAAWCVPQALEPASSAWWTPAQWTLTLLSGAISFFALMAWLWPGRMAAGGVPSLVLFGAICAALLLADWLAQGRDSLQPLGRHWPRWSLLAAVLVVPLLLALTVSVAPAQQRPVWAVAVLAMLAAMFFDARGRMRTAEYRPAPNVG